MNEEQSTSARITVIGPIPDQLIDFSMMAVDEAGDRRIACWISTSLGMPPGAMLMIMHRIGLLMYDSNWNQILAFDFARNDYVPYTSHRLASWWNRVWLDVTHWLEEEYGS